MPAPSYHRFALCCTAFASVINLLSPQLNADDWNQWRGPNGLAIAADGNAVPTDFSPSKNVLWSAQVVGAGHSSPTVVGDLVVVTTADSTNQRQAVLGFERATGKPAFTTIVSEGGFPETHPKNTHASPTVCSNGELFFATFHHHNKVEAVAVNQAGKIVWKTDVGAFRPKQYLYGYAASPTLHNGKLIISGDCDTVAWLVALDSNSGKVVWKTDRPKMLNWASPIVANVAGKNQLLLSGAERIASYNPENGKLLWETPCLTMATCGTVVWDNDTVYASGGYPKKETVAVKADGSGQVVWRNRVKCYEQSMLIHSGYLYAFDDNGILYCWDAKSGREMWKQRFRGPVSASLTMADGKIFACNERGNVWVFEASPNGYQPVAQNQMGTSLFATPTVVDNVMYLRAASGEGRSRQEAIFAIGNR
ncbi:MAG: PQQ-binding-like beta-propeller repeat protein [Fuerstiella sp.]